MGRSRVLSFMSQLSGGGYRDSRSPTPPAQDNTTSATTPPKQQPREYQTSTEPFPAVPTSPVRGDGTGFAATNDSPMSGPYGRTRSSSRPVSMIQTWTPPVMDLNDTIPELQPIFTFLNSHANKLYQEGYFLKLDDQNSQGRPNPDRTWTECFAQLVGTVLSLWDAAELDTAGEDGEVLPKFINLTDASIKMIDSLPTRSHDEQPLQNILSVSTAGRNRYLLHFNSHHSLIQWTSSIRLAMFEQASLQEAYTGALIAGKGKTVNNINLIMDRARFKTEEWVRVRFGAGVPWRRCWCVITPPDEKEMMKLQKEKKKRSPYDRSHAPILKGDIKFYDTKKEGKKQKKAKPIATLTNAYAAYAIYPQSKALIDASTLLKIEGTVTIHSDPPSSTEGFVFIMPEVHPAVTGFEMLMRFLFPAWDTFGLYGRPGRLVASVLDPRSLMFAMPKHRRYGYMDVLDVSGLVLADGSSSWTERDWRKKLKELTGQRMAAMDEAGGSPGGSGTNSRRNSKRLSSGPQSANANNLSSGERMPVRPKVNFADDGDSVRAPKTRDRTDSAPPTAERQRLPSSMAQAVAIANGHSRNFSDTGLDGHLPPTSNGGGQAGGYYRGQSPSPPIRGYVNDLAATPERISSEDELPSRVGTPPARDLQDMHQKLQAPEPVYAPPAFNHAPSSRPPAAPYHSPELRRANSRLSTTTLAQLAKAGGVAPPDWSPTDHDIRPSSRGSSRLNGSRTDLTIPGPVPAAEPTIPDLSATLANSAPRSPGLPPPNMSLPIKRSKSPLTQAQIALGPSPDVTSKSLPRPGTGSSQNAGPHSLDTMPPPYQEANLHPYSATRTPPPSGSRDGRSPSPYYQGDGWHTPPETQGSLPSPKKSPQPQRQQTPSPKAAPAITSPVATAGAAATAAAVATVAATGAPLAPLKTKSPSILRKPLPPRADSQLKQKAASEPQSAVSSAGSLPDYYIDEDALNKVHYTDSDGPRQEIRRQDTKRSEASSKYDDNDTSSTASPDYASTHESIKTQESVERPRAGVLKTVGDTSQPPSQRPEESLDIPEVNFGPTYNLAAQNIPRNKTPTPLAASSGLPIRKSPRGEHFRQDSDDTLRRRSVAWQPGSAVVGGTPGGDQPSTSLTPEQFVMQRFSQAQATAPYAHQRNLSNNTLTSMRANTPTPTMRRNSSHDLLSAPVLSHHRTGSAGAASTLGPSVGVMAGSGKADMSSHLSAREQEHLARMTGTPLISMAGGGRKQQQTGGPGLVGAIAAREREKQQMKEGFSSQAVQHAINQRQQLQFQQQQQQQVQMYGRASPGLYGGYQLPPGYGPPQSHQQTTAPLQPGFVAQPGWGTLQGGQQASFMGPGVPQQGVQGVQGYGTGQYGASSPDGMGIPRSRTPNAMGGRGSMMYNGQAF